MTANLEVLPDPDALATRAADLMTSIAGAKPRVAIALSGGSTPRRLYQLLATSPRLETFPWANVHWFWGDERFVPPDDPASNYRMTREAMLVARAGAGGPYPSHADGRPLARGGGGSLRAHAEGLLRRRHARARPAVVRPRAAGPRHQRAHRLAVSRHAGAGRAAPLGRHDARSARPARASPSPTPRWRAAARRSSWSRARTRRRCCTKSSTATRRSPLPGCSPKARCVSSPIARQHRGDRCQIRTHLQSILAARA